MAAENNKYYERLIRLLNEKVLRQKQIDEIYYEKEQIIKTATIEEAQSIPVAKLEVAFKWYSENKLFENKEEKSLVKNALSNLSDTETTITYEQAKLCNQILNEFIYKGDYEKRILDIKFTDLQKVLENSTGLSSKEKRLLKQTIIKLSNNEYSQISYIEAKLAVTIHDEAQFNMEENELDIDRSEIDMSAPLLAPDMMSEELNMSSELRAFPDYQEEEIDNESYFLKKMILEIQDLLEFSKKLDDSLIVSYVDGHTDQTENELFKRLIRIDEELKKEVELMMKANSFFGRVGGEVKDNPDALAELMEFEKNLKKNELNPVKNSFVSEKLSLATFFNYVISHFKIKDYSFAAFATCLFVFGFLTAPVRVMIAQNPAFISVDNYLNKEDILITASKNEILTRSLMIMEKKQVCNFPKTMFNNREFEKFFKIQVIKNTTANQFDLSNNGFVQVGDKIKLYLRSNLNGNLVVKHHSENNEKKTLKLEKPNSECKLTTLISSDYSSDGNNFVQIGQKEGYNITHPLGNDTLIISLIDKETFSGIFSFTTVDLSEFQIHLKKENWNKEKIHISLPNTNLHKFYSNYFTQKFLPYKQKHKSWGKKNDLLDGKYEKVFIDFDGDNKAEIIAIDQNFDGLIDYYILDRNDNNITDTLIYPIIEENKLSYRWLMDLNEDQIFEEYGKDINNDWVIDKRNDI